MQTVLYPQDNEALCVCRKGLMLFTGADWMQF